MKKNVLQSYFLALLIFLNASLFAPALISEVRADEPARQPEKREVVYALLGKRELKDDLIVVNHFHAEEESDLSDYGDYSEISRLTGDNEIRQEGDTIRTHLPAGDWYYQGKLEGRELPWELRFSYKLDENEMEPEELAGKSGNFDFTLDLIPKQDAPKIYREAYFMMMSISLDSQNVRNISAPQAITATSGKSLLLNFMLYPNKAQTIHFSCEVQDFTMPSPTLSALPITADLSDLKVEDLLSGEQIFKFFPLAQSAKKDGSHTESLFSGFSEGMKQLRESSAAFKAKLEDLSESSEELLQEAEKLELSEKDSEAMEGLVSAMRLMQKGLADMAGNYSTFDEKLGESAENSHAIADELQDLGGDYREKINALFQKLIPVYHPESFVSPKNKGVQSVQFVILGPSIDLNRDEATAPEDLYQEEAPKTFAELLSDLFKGPKAPADTEEASDK